MRQLILVAVASAALTLASTAASGPIADTAPQGRIAYSERFWPKDERIVDNWEILIRTIGTRRSVNLTRNPRCDESTPSWSHDGRWVAHACDGPAAGIYVIRDDGSGRRRVVPLRSRHSSGPTWSPDDRKLAFAVPNGICTVNVDGGGLHRLTHGRDTSPTWSADGRTIAFQREVRGVHAVLQMRADGSVKRVVARRASTPAWSPDGTTIAYVSRGALWLMDPDGGRKRRVPRIPGAGGGWGVIEATWSPDSRFLAYQHYGTHAIARGVHISAVDGANRRLVFEFIDPLPGIAWGPPRS